MFIDQAEIIVQSGKGGDGSLHFRREKYVPRGGPDGGDGGKGGSVLLVVVPSLTTLYTYHQKNRYQAKDGGNGSKQKMTGRSADDLLIPVPAGTMVFDAETGILLGDLTDPDQNIIVAKGGRGGRGNTHFKSATRQVPMVAEKGEPGEERRLRLELKLIADVGIIGVPNAGKSTLLAALTNARPKTAPYPFTTLEPNLGIAHIDEETNLVLADIPGLIEGAHLGVGLGHDFLRHIQRTRVLIHVLDGMAEDPLLDFSQIISELALFDPDLAKKPQVVAFNKMDISEVESRWIKIQVELQERVHQQASKIWIDTAVIPVSAATGFRTRELIYRAAQLLEQAPAPVVSAELPVYRSEEDPKAFTISKVENGWRVAGEAIERAAQMTYWEHYQSIRRFQRILETLGIDAALRKAGVKSGDTVYIGDYDLEWQD